MSHDGCPHIATASPYFVNNLHEVVDGARAEGPIAWDDAHDRWFITSWHAARSVLADWETFTSTAGCTGIDGTPLMPPIDTDPPLHTDWRKLLFPFFSRKSVRTWEPGVRAVATGLMDQFDLDHPVEFVSALARPYPGAVFFGEVMGLPTDDVSQCQEWAEMVVGISPHGEPADGYAGLMGYVANLVRDRRARPAGEGVIDAIIGAEIQGSRVAEATAVNTIMMLILGGLETTTNTLGSAVLHLARHHDHQGLFRHRAEARPAAVEELLRLYAPTIGLCRKATATTALENVTVAQGERVAVSYLAANHDPAEFDAPHEFRMDRLPGHLAFGYGIHFCLGSHLARLLLEVALGELVDRYSSIELAPEAVTRYQASSVHTLERLDLVLVEGT